MDLSRKCHEGKAEENRHSCTCFQTGTVALFSNRHSCTCFQTGTVALAFKQAQLHLFSNRHSCTCFQTRRWREVSGRRKSPEVLPPKKNSSIHLSGGWVVPTADVTVFRNEEISLERNSKYDPPPARSPNFYGG